MGDSFLMAMPWKTRNLEEQRWELVRLMRGGKVSVCELCRRLLISRKTAYKWRRRHRLARSALGCTPALLNVPRVLHKLAALQLQFELGLAGLLQALGCLVQSLYRLIATQ